ncbi:hypothetical protein CKAH01_17010 [Colletotrichum kahawae]|uniref:Uncharacterized protein n=1 Tax=Colletotrichum kahawae TaxID=34407 RepID=A0AAD9YDN4_COLKA|nr:hypothetical protein CKAH01_17010 [Colletotrichum kahawae]
MGSRLFLQLSPAHSQAKTNTTKHASFFSEQAEQWEASKQASEADGNQCRHHLSTSMSFALQDSVWASVVRFTDTMASLTYSYSTFLLTLAHRCLFRPGRRCIVAHNHGLDDLDDLASTCAFLFSYTQWAWPFPIVRKRKRRTAHGAPVGRLPSSSYRGISALALRLQTCSVTAPSEAVQDADEQAGRRTHRCVGRLTPSEN